MPNKLGGSPEMSSRKALQRTIFGRIKESRGGPRCRYEWLRVGCTNFNPMVKVPGLSKLGRSLNNFPRRLPRAAQARVNFA